MKGTATTATTYKGVGMRGCDKLQLEGLQVVEMAMEIFRLPSCGWRKALARWG